MQFVKSNLEPVTIEINGVKYPARLTFKALAELEELTHMGFMKLFDNFAKGEFELEQILNIIYVALKYGGVEIARDDLIEMDFSLDFLQGAMEEISTLMNRTLKVTTMVQDHKKTKKDEGDPEKKL